MHLKDYFRGQRIQLCSPLSAEVVSERVGAEVGSPFWSFSTGVVGRVWNGHVRLKVSNSPFEYNAKPVLAGTVRNRAVGSEFDLLYRAPAGAGIFFIVWYGFLTFLGLGALTNSWNPELTRSDIAFVVAIYGVLLVAPIGMHIVGTRHSDSDLADLIDFLVAHTDAKPKP
jgi:hypothetical protein